MRRMVRPCPICGGTSFLYGAALWQGLIDEWCLSADEAEYINRQQGERCTGCTANLRSLALGDALRAVMGADLLVKDLVDTDAFRATRVLEVNEANELHRWLKGSPGR